MDPTFFETPEGFRGWLERHHADETELWVGFRKKASGLPSLTWPESVDEALCYGWIDGLRRSLDVISYAIRFTPRRPDSIWSQVNLARVEVLRRDGRMRPAGLAVWKQRDEARTRSYAYERERARFSAEQRARFESESDAWAFFQAQTPSYRKQSTAWVVTAKRPDTRDRRLTQLIACSASGEFIPPLAWSRSPRTGPSPTRGR